MGGALRVFRLFLVAVSVWSIGSAFGWGTGLQDTVTRVVDGDTVILARLGRARLIGVDTPESVRPDYPVEHFAREAAGFTRKSLEGHEVTVEFGAERTDSHGRQLVHIYRQDGTHFNAQLIKLGYGFAYTRFPFECMIEFLEYEDLARRRGKGMWARSMWAEPGSVFHGNRGSRVYHSPSCEHYDCANCTIELESRVKAESEGFRPHARCVLSVY